MQVAEALSDKRVQAWAADLGALAADVSWTSTTSSEEMHDVLLSLSTDTRAAVLQHMLARITPARALTTLPPTLHPYLVAAMVDSTGELVLPRASSPAVAPFMAILPSLHASGCPPLRNLDCSGSEVRPSSCHLLTEVLSRQPGISHLALAVPEPHAASARVLHMLLPSLQALPALLHLELCSPQHDSTISLTTVDALAAALSSLRYLNQLTVEDIDCHVDLSPSPDPDTAVARIATHAAVKNGQLARALSAVAAHPSITTLRFVCVNMLSALPWPPVFPTLRDLDVVCWLADPHDNVVRLEELTRRQVAAATPDHDAAVELPALTSLSFALCSEQGGALEYEVHRAIAAVLHPRWMPIGAGPGGEASDNRHCPLLASLWINLSFFKAPISLPTERRVWQQLGGVPTLPPCTYHAVPGSFPTRHSPCHPFFFFSIAVVNVAALRQVMRG